MQAMLSDKNGRVLIIESELGYRLEHVRYSLITNYSVLEPEITKSYIVSGDDRYEKADESFVRSEPTVVLQQCPYRCAVVGCVGASKIIMPFQAMRKSEIIAEIRGEMRGLCHQYFPFLTFS